MTTPNAFLVLVTTEPIDPEKYSEVATKLIETLHKLTQTKLAEFTKPHLTEPWCDVEVSMPCYLSHAKLKTPSARQTRSRALCNHIGERSKVGSSAMLGSASVDQIWSVLARRDVPKKEVALCWAVTLLIRSGRPKRCVGHDP